MKMTTVIRASPYGKKILRCAALTPNEMNVRASSLLQNAGEFQP